MDHKYDAVVMGGDDVNSMLFMHKHHSIISLVCDQSDLIIIVTCKDYLQMSNNTNLFH